MNRSYILMAGGLVLLSLPLAHAQSHAQSGVADLRVGRRSAETPTATARTSIPEAQPRAAFSNSEARSSQAGGNDNCEDKSVITDGDWAYDTTGATTDGNAHASCEFDGQTYHDIWYNYTASCSGLLTLSTCSQAYYDTDLVVYDGCLPDIPCPPGDAELLGCNDDANCPPFASEVIVPVFQDNCYTIRVGGWNAGDQGTGTLSVSCDVSIACGDDVCEGVENCCNCELDCGPCVCGDGTCNGPCESCEECEDCGGCGCPAPLVYDNGLWDGVNGGRPTVGWSLAGCIDDFVLPDPDFGGTRFSCVQVAFAADTTPNPTAWELRIYDLDDVDGQGGGDGTIAGLGDFNLAVPKCFLTYSISDGSMTISHPHDCGFLRCLYDIDGVGEVCDLDPGHYGFHIMFADAGDDGFWLTAPQDESECLAVWGPAVPFPADFCEPIGPAFHNVHFNMRGFQPCEQCPFDGDDDGQIGAFDLANLLGAWGACDGDECLCVDADADGQVDAFDLANLLGVWGPCS